MGEEFYEDQYTREPIFYSSSELHQVEEWEPLRETDLAFEENLPYPFWNRNAP